MLVVILGLWSVILSFRQRHPCLWIVFSQRGHYLGLDNEYHLIFLVFLEFGSSAVQVHREGAMETEMYS